MCGGEPQSAAMVERGKYIPFESNLVTVDGDQLKDLPQNRRTALAEERHRGP